MAVVLLFTAGVTANAQSSPKAYEYAFLLGGGGSVAWFSPDGNVGPVEGLDAFLEELSSLYPDLDHMGQFPPLDDQDSAAAGLADFLQIWNVVGAYGWEYAGALTESNRRVFKRPVR